MKSFVNWLEAVDELGMRGDVDANYVQKGVEAAAAQKQMLAQQKAAYDATPQGVLNANIRQAIQQASTTLIQQLSKFNNIRDGYAPKAKILQKYPKLIDAINELNKQFSQINIDQESQQQ